MSEGLQDALDRWDQADADKEATGEEVAALRAESEARRVLIMRFTHDLHEAYDRIQALESALREASSIGFTILEWFNMAVINGVRLEHVPYADIQRLQVLDTSDPPRRVQSDSEQACIRGGELGMYRSRVKALESALRELLNIFPLEDLENDLCDWNLDPLEAFRKYLEGVHALLTTNDSPRRVQSDSEQAMRDYAQSNEGRAAIQKGYEDYKAGRVVPAKEVLDELDSGSESSAVNACQTDARTPEARQALSELMAAAHKKLGELYPISDSEPEVEGAT